MPSPTQQLLSQTIYATDGLTSDWNFSFADGYLDASHVKAYYLDSGNVRTELTTFTLSGPYQIHTVSPLPAGLRLVIYRDTPKTAPLVNFTDGSGLTELALDTNARQAVMLAAEAADSNVNSTTATAEQAAAAAAISALAASDSAIAAAASVSGANAEAVAAGLSATNAAASAVSANDSAIAAAASAESFVAAVQKTAATGSAVLPSGTTAQRDVIPAPGYLRYNSTTASFEGYSGSVWGSIGGGATGSGGDTVFYENDQVVNNSHIITKNSHTVGPITVATGATLTVNVGKRLVIL